MLRGLDTGRVAPYAGGGIGLGRQSRDFVSVTDLALSAAGGARVDLTQRVAATGEFRLRGLGRDFSATTAEWMAGLSFAIGQ
jgi:opacity protein-like surface antigen